MDGWHHKPDKKSMTNAAQSALRKQIDELVVAGVKTALECAKFIYGIRGWTCSHKKCSSWHHNEAKAPCRCDQPRVAPVGPKQPVAATVAKEVTLVTKASGKSGGAKSGAKGSVNDKVKGGGKCCAEGNRRRRGLAARPTTLSLRSCAVRPATRRPPRRCHNSLPVPRVRLPSRRHHYLAHECQQRSPQQLRSPLHLWVWTPVPVDLEEVGQQVGAATVVQDVADAKQETAEDLRAHVDHLRKGKFTKTVKEMLARLEERRVMLVKEVSDNTAKDDSMGKRQRDRARLLRIES